MEATYKLNANELDENFLNALKAIFQDRIISITVETDDIDETEYLMATEANRIHLEKALNSKDRYAFTSEEFDQLNKDLLVGKKVNADKFKVKKK